MRRKLVTAAWGLGLWALPGIAGAQETPEIKPNLNWVFQFSVLVLLMFVAVCAVSFVYYMVAVAARNRKLAAQAAVATAAPARVPVGAAAPAAAPPAAVASPAPAPAAAPPAAAPAPAPAPATATEAPAPQPQPAEAPPAAVAPSAAAPAADTGGLPRIDPMNLPAGIDAVTRGRLKKLAVLQERGQAPPAELVDHLRGVLEQMGGAPVAAAPTAAAPAAAAPATPPPAAAPASEAAAPAPTPPAAAAEAPPAPAAPAEPPPAQPAPPPAADTGDVPRIDPTNLPAGIDAVARGRLKKLAVLQERGQAPPADLIESLRPILDQMKGS